MVLTTTPFQNTEKAFGRSTNEQFNCSCVKCTSDMANSVRVNNFGPLQACYCANAGPLSKGEAVNLVKPTYLAAEVDKAQTVLADYKIRVEKPCR